MNINSKIEIHRGVYFPNPDASALSLNVEVEGSLASSEFAVIKRHSTNANKLVVSSLVDELAAVNAGTGLNVAGPVSTVAAFQEFAVNMADRIYICYQGSEEPYNQPTSGATYLKPDYLVVKVKDAYFSFEPQATDVDATAYAAAVVGGEIGIGFSDTDNEVGLVLRDTAGAFTECVAGTFTNTANIVNFVPIAMISAKFTDQGSDDLLTVVC